MQSHVPHQGFFNMLWQVLRQYSNGDASSWAVTAASGAMGALAERVMVGSGPHARSDSTFYRNALVEMHRINAINPHASPQQLLQSAQRRLGQIRADDVYELEAELSGVLALLLLARRRRIP